MAPATRSPFRPDEWADPKRAKYLMADFRPRAANPDGYDAKMAFWKRSITAWSSSNQILSFTVADVQQAFARDGVLPAAACIRRVLSEMLADAEIRPRQEVERVLTERLAASSWSSSLSRGVGLISKPLSWSWNYLTSSYSSAGDSVADRVEDEQAFVKMSSLSEAAERLFRELTTSVSSDRQIRKYSELAESSAASGFSKSDMQLLLLYLQSEKKACVIDDCGTRLVKLGDAAAFTQLELGLFRLESAKELLEKDVRQIELEMSSLKELARQAINNNNRSQATQLLRRKKRLQNLLLNKESQLDNIHVLLQQMSDSDSNVMILQSFQQAADVLKGIQSAGPSVADQTMLDVEDVVQNAVSLQSDLSRAIDPDLDEGLEQELREIMQSEQDHTPGQVTDDVDDLLSRLQRLRTPDSGNPQPQLAAVPRRPKAAAVPQS